MAPDSVVADRVLDFVSKHTSMTSDQIRSKSRLDYVVGCRHMWWLAIKLGLGWPSTRVASAVRRCDHSAILYGWHAFEVRPKEWQDTLAAVVTDVQTWQAARALKAEQVGGCLTGLLSVRDLLTQDDLATIRQIVATKKPGLNDPAE